VLQAVDRAGACDEVLAGSEDVGTRQGPREATRRYRNLCRRLGFGMLGVTGSGEVEVIVRPVTTARGRDPKKRSRLVAGNTTSARARSDPSAAAPRSPIMTA